MSRPRERDEQEALKLDEYFKETLARVRPYILALTAPDDVQLCRLWLDKLSHALSQRNLRNQYLFELCRQLKSGHLDGIFGRAPTNGSLVPLSRLGQMVSVSSSLSEISDSSTSPYYSWFRPSTKSTQRHSAPMNKISLKKRESGTTSTSLCFHGARMASSSHFYENGRTDRNQFNIYRQRIDTLTTIVKDLQIQNERLNQELAQCHENCNSDERPQLQANVKQLTAEVTSLKAKLMEVQKMKDTLETNHKAIIEQYKSTITEQFSKMKLRLEEAQSKNIELDNIVVAITQKLDIITHNKEEEVKNVKTESTQKIEDMRKQYDLLIEQKDKEIQTKDEIINRFKNELSEKDLAHREQVESLFNKIRELDDKLQMKIEEEDKLQMIVSEQCATMKEEFAKIRNELETVNQKKIQDMTHKISSLKKNVQKLEKSKEKLIHDYEKQIYRILKDKEHEIKTLQVQLQGQRSEISMTLNSEKQCELDTLVTNLEERYRTLLAAVDASADSQRQNYLKVEHEVEVYRCLIKRQRGSGYKQKSRRG
ncbi:centrosomal protein of 112 kDa isoform X2 [Cephus cinctus]|uniref:Centrosomal protein of 112 kDa isoform X2 n=1 Tax=Cephus cinctus TaxID=211228 RepID=A0AAJ7FTY4_CEPCN|nr:centrosomal protein of 112 kDa isoform X2 [Cephus cinctus]